MKVSYQWLSEYVDVSGYTARDLAEKLTRSGIEVDVIEERNKGVTKVVVGHVVSREKHPDADKLNVCKVNAGTGEELQIVCGAKNVDAGQKVPVALVGAKLPGGLDIKRAKLRGVESQGMICSAKELGLNEKLLPKEQQEGILVLPTESEVGTEITNVLSLDDEVLELELTPNRSDALSMLGVAYEIAAILGREVKLPNPEQGMETTGQQASEAISVTIDAKEQCAHYSARLIENVKVGPSPLWMQNRLIAAGIRPISNIVDITNYVMLEYGQPLHAFDADRIAGGAVHVRLAKEGERLVTLDGADRTLEPHMLLIADPEKPVGLAGVMGGANSEVEEGTTRILLESARFAGSSVRRTSRQLGLRSEASLRFEKEVNADAVIDALNRAASLMSQYAGGRVAQGIVEQKLSQPAEVSLSLTLERVNGYLGTSMTMDEVQDIFSRLNFSVEKAGAEELTVKVPRRRADITRDVDLLEEVARLYGYDNIPTELMTGVTTPGALTKEQTIRRGIRTVLNQSGLHEVVTYSLTQPRLNEVFRPLGADTQNLKPIGLSLPMSEERSVLRSSLLPHLIEVAVYNRNRNMDDVAIFETASIFLTEEDALTKLPEERTVTAALWTGKRSEPHWSEKSRPVDFFDLKGVLEKLLASLGIHNASFEAAQAPGYHPGRTAAVRVTAGEASIELGLIGQLHPQVQHDFDLDDTYVFELDMAEVYRAAGNTIAYRTLPRFPAVTRDIAVVADAGLAVGQLKATVAEVGGELLESIGVFDIYTGERIGEGKKSVALSLVYRHPERTLTDEEIAEAHGKVVAALESRHGAELRK
ncbi:phenylalanine--tRNA ligase subunit beta [Paenibacillus turpanensis]|uniref:phenylalanine--tRNA ligase subunit beta n=1 Tax=Paenibacillus turpanensis TaxID=2689078 RepID=UPI00140895DE